MGIFNLGTLKSESRKHKQWLLSQGERDISEGILLCISEDTNSGNHQGTKNVLGFHPNTLIF